jgi:hypothetical protein
MAVAAQQDAPAAVCSLASEDIADAGPRSLVQLLGRLGIDALHVARDGRDDLVTLDGGPVEGAADPALRIEAIRFATGAVRRDAVDGVARFLGRGSVADQLHPVFGVPPAALIRRGEWQVVILDTAGDPTASPSATRVWELGLQGTNAMRNVPGFPSLANPYAGTRHVLSYFQVPVEGGGFDARVGRTDLGSDRLGPDRQTRFFNATPRFAAFAWQEGVAFLLPRELDPTGFRPIARGGGSTGWDFVQAPGGPMALMPADGSAPGLFDLAQLRVIERPLTQSAVIDGDARQDHRFPAAIELVFGSPLLDPAEPMHIDLGYRAEGTTVRFEDLVGQPVGGGLFASRFGIPGPGLYEFEQWLVEELGELPEGWDQLSEATRALGIAMLRIGEDEGPLHGPLVGPWLMGPGFELRHRHAAIPGELVLLPDQPPGRLWFPATEGDVTEPAVDIVELAIGRTAATPVTPARLGVGIRTAGGASPEGAFSSFVELRCRDGSGTTAAPGHEFRVIHERHDGVERTVTDGIAESSVVYRETAWGHILDLPLAAGAGDFLWFCSAFTGMMDEPDGEIVRDTLPETPVTPTTPVADVGAMLDELLGRALVGSQPVATTEYERGDVSLPTVDITGVAVARTDVAGGSVRVGLGVRTAGGPAPGTRRGSSVMVHCRVRTTGGTDRAFTIFHYDWEDSEQTYLHTLDGGYDRDLAAAGVTYQRTPWGHSVTFMVDGVQGAQDAVVVCEVVTSTQDAQDGWVSDRTGEMLIELTEPVEDILEEIDLAFVPA